MEVYKNPYWSYVLEVALQEQSKLRLKQPLQGKRSETLSKQDVIKLASLEPDSNIEQLFTFSGDFDETWLWEQLQRFIHTSESLQELAEGVDHLHLLRLGVFEVSKRTELSFRLRMMQACMEHQFKRTMFCLLMVTFESSLEGREERVFVDLFLCAACHDVGLLGITREQVDSHFDHIPMFDHKSEYMSHVAYSVEFITRHNLASDRVIRGVYEHHERMDGTGYPRRLSGLRLGEYGQHIHLYDTAYSIFHYKFEPLGKSLGDLIPVVEMNAVTHFGQVATRFIALLKKVSRTESFIVTDEQFKKVWWEVLHTTAFVQASINACQEFTQQVGFRHDDKKLLALQNGFFHIALAMHRTQENNTVLSFMESKELKGSLQEQRKSLEDVYIMMREISYHIDIFYRQLRSYRNASNNDIVNNAAKEALKSLASLKRLPKPDR